MIQLRKSEDRGHADHGWLKSKHSFSFADYYDPKNMGFRSLRVINEDWIAGERGFGMHPHQDMEIISYVVEGALEHKDSMGNQSIIKPGEVQKMSAGTGVFHSEYNPSSQKTHLLQIWIIPDKRGIAPSYAQKNFEKQFAEKPLTLVGSKGAREGSIHIEQDVNIYVLKLPKGQSYEFKQSIERHTWIQTVKGGLKINNHPLSMGDALAASEETLLKMEALEDSELLVFDLS